MYINLQQLRVFYYVVQQSSMAAAARSLFISRPAVTMQIRNFENQLGFDLFSSKRGGLKLTGHGRHVYRFAEKVFNEVEKLERYVDGATRERNEVLIFGAHHVIAQCFLPSILEHVRDFSPNLNIQVLLGGKEDSFERILDRSMHVAVIIGPAYHPQLVTHHLYDEDALLVSSPHGFWAQKQKISVVQLKNIPLILPQKRTGVYTAIMGFLHQHGIDPIVPLDNISSDIIKSFLMQRQDTVAFIPRYAVQQEIRDGTLKEIPLIEGNPVLPTNLVYLLQDPLPSALQIFLDGISSFAFCTP